MQRMTADRLAKLKTVFLAIPPAPRAAVAGIAITCALFVFVLLLVRPAFGINDDVTIIEMIRAGQIAPYVDSTYGSILHLLYAHVSPGFPWYGAWLLAVLGASIALLTSVAIHHYRGYIRLLLILLILGLNFPFIVTMDYSTVGIAGAASAIVVALLLTLRDALTNLRALLLGLLATVSMWLRLEGIIAAFVFVAPVLLTVLVIYLRRHEVRRLFRYGPLLLFAAPLVVSSVVDYVHKTEFSSPQYREYSQWNALRGEFHAYPISRLNRNNPAVLSATGWSETDYDNLLSWFFIDERLYNVRSMTAFFATARPATLSTYSMQYLIGRMEHLATVYWYYWTLLLGALLFAVSMKSDDRLQRWICVFGPLYVFFFIFVMDAFLRYPERVARPSIGAFVLAYVFSIIELKKDRDTGELPIPKALLTISIAAIATGMFFVVKVAHDERTYWANAQIAYERVLEHLNEKYRGYSILIQPGGGLWTQFQSPLEAYTTEFHPIEIGWQTFSPLFYDQIHELGVDKGYEMPSAMVNNANALILSRLAWSDRVVDYLHDREHMPAARKVLVEQLDHNLYLYRLVNP